MHHRPDIGTSLRRRVAGGRLVILVPEVLDATEQRDGLARVPLGAQRQHAVAVEPNQVRSVVEAVGYDPQVGAVGRVSPFYYVQDGVVPRTQIAPTLRYIGEVSEKYGLKISNIFHAGDGNMHPIILFNARKPGDLEKAQKAGEDILAYCVSVGGSITGEHGVGMEKMNLMPLLFSSETLDMIASIKALFDPECRLNPGKVLPTGKGCMEMRQPALSAHTTTY